MACVIQASSHLKLLLFLPSVITADTMMAAKPTGQTVSFCLFRTVAMFSPTTGVKSKAHCRLVRVHRVEGLREQRVGTVEDQATILCFTGFLLHSCLTPL